MPDRRYRNISQTWTINTLTDSLLSTPEDNVRRKLVGIMVNAFTTPQVGAQILVKRAGYEVARIEESEFSTAYGPLPFDVWFEPGIQIGISTNCGAAAPVPVTVGVTVIYELA
jgi:hypothetical protein